MQPPTLCDQAREDGKMAIMTIDQALASPTATGITIVDTPTNIARGSLTASLLPRVTAFNMNANGATSPGDAKLLAGLGTLFSKNSFTLTVRGSVADLTNPANAAGLTLANIKAVFDTATIILAAATQPVITSAKTSGTIPIRSALSHSPPTGSAMPCATGSSAPPVSRSTAPQASPPSSARSIFRVLLIAAAARALREG